MNIIPDKQIDLNKTDILKTSIYSETLLEFIDDYKGTDSLTIGLIGSWGTGKSSIVETLQKNIKLQNKPYGYVYYDAWKYSDDPFRRTFIKELGKQLGLEMKDELENFYRDSSHEIKANYSLNKDWWVWLIICSLFSYFVYTAIKLFAGQITQWQIVEFVLPLSFGLLGTFFANAFVLSKFSVNIPRFFSPEQFEETFNDALHNALGKNVLNKVTKWIKKEKTFTKVIIIVDNIDRCHPKLSIELILTIKSFLGVENCIFIVPIDDLAIKKALSKGSDRDKEEFLRKFFNLVIRLKPYKTTDLLNFCRDLIKKYSVKIDENESDAVSYLISQEFANNPRRIIQFINNLQAEITLAEHQEEKGYIKQGLLTGNIPLLAKFLIIKEEWPALFNQFDLDPFLLKKINNKIISNSIVEKDNSYIFSDLDVSLDRSQFYFLSRTTEFVCTNSEPFIRLIDHDKEYSDTISTYIENSDWDSLKTSVEKGEISFANLWNKIRDEFDYSLIKHDLVKITGISLFRLVIAIFTDEHIENVNIKFVDYLAKIKKWISDTRFIPLFSNFNPNKLILLAKRFENENQTFLRDNILEYLKSAKISDHTKDLLMTYIKTFPTETTLKGLSITFTNILENYPALNLDLGEGIDKEVVYNSLYTNEDVNRMINKITNNTSENNSLIIQRIKEINRYIGLSVEQTKNYLEKIKSYIDNNDYSAMDYWFDAITDILQNLEDPTLILNYKTIIINRKDFLFNDFYSSGQRSKSNQQVQLKFLNIIKEFYLIDKSIISEGDLDGEVIQVLKEYFGREEDLMIVRHVNSIFYEIVDYFSTYDWPFRGDVINKFISTDDFDLKDMLFNTVSLMLNKTEVKDTIYTGLQEEWIVKIVAHVLNLFMTGNELGKQFIDKLKSISIVLSFISKQIELLSVEEQEKLLILLPEIYTESSLNVLYKNILYLHLNDYHRLSEIIKIIKNQSEEKMFNVLLKSLLADISESENGHVEDKSRIKLLVNSQEDLQQEDLQKLITHLERYLGSNEYPQREFGLKQLIKIKRLPKQSKASLKKLLTSIKTNSNSHKVIIKDLIERVNL
jgi:hypothetical protein